MSMLLKILHRLVKMTPGLLLIDSVVFIVCSSREERIAIAARVLSMCHWEMMRGCVWGKKYRGNETSAFWYTGALKNVIDLYCDD